MLADSIDEVGCVDLKEKGMVLEEGALVVDQAREDPGSMGRSFPIGHTPAAPAGRVRPTSKSGEM